MAQQIIRKVSFSGLSAKGGLSKKRIKVLKFPSTNHLFLFRNGDSSEPLTEDLLKKNSGSLRDKISSRILLPDIGFVALSKILEFKLGERAMKRLARGFS
jgi:hypothetical protein